MRHDENIKHYNPQPDKFEISAMEKIVKTQSSPSRSRHAFAQTRVTTRNSTHSVARARRDSQRPYPTPSSVVSRNQDLANNGSATSASAHTHISPAPSRSSPQPLSDIVEDRSKVFSDFDLRSFLGPPRSRTSDTSANNASSLTHRYASSSPAMDMDYFGAVSDDEELSLPPSPQEGESTFDDVDSEHWIFPDAVSQLNAYGKPKMWRGASGVTSVRDARVGRDATIAVVGNEDLTSDYGWGSAPFVMASEDVLDSLEDNESECVVGHPQEEIYLTLAPRHSDARTETHDNSERTLQKHNEDVQHSVHRRAVRHLEHPESIVRDEKRIRLPGSTPPLSLASEPSDPGTNTDPPESLRLRAHSLTFDSEPPESPRLHLFSDDFEEQDQLEDHVFDYFDTHESSAVPTQTMRSRTQPRSPASNELTLASLRKLEITQHARSFALRGMRYPGHPPSPLGPYWRRFHGK